MNRVFLFMGSIFAGLGALFLVLGIWLFIATGEGMALIFSGLGLPFFLIGLGFLFKDARDKKKEQQLRESGSRILADLVAVQFNTSVRVNGRCPFIIQCQAVNPADGKVYLFESKNFWYDPEPFLQDRPKIPVLVDGDNYQRYLVLTDGILPEQG